MSGTLPWLTDARSRFGDLLTRDRVPHALLLQGPAGLGKRRLAADISARLLCTGEGDGACGNCRSCRLLQGGAHPDRQLLEIGINPRTGEPRREIIIEQVRELIAALQLTTTVSPRKVAVIQPAEAMNRSAANALLKTLEEPAGDTVLVLVSHDPRRLPATIRSRCQRIAVRPPARDAVLEWLRTEHGVAEADAALALDAACDAPLTALALLQESEHEGYHALRAALRALLQPGGELGQALEAGQAPPDAQRWVWLSRLAAQAFSDRVRGQASEVLPEMLEADPRRLSALQQAADRNHRLAETPVRQDFLLEAWLLEWSRLAEGTRGS